MSTLFFPWCYFDCDFQPSLMGEHGSLRYGQRTRDASFAFALCDSARCPNRLCLISLQNLGLMRLDSALPRDFTLIQSLGRFEELVLVPRFGIANSAGTCRPQNVGRDRAAQGHRGS